MTEMSFALWWREREGGRGRVTRVREGRGVQTGDKEASCPEPIAFCTEAPN